MTSAPPVELLVCTKCRLVGQDSPSEDAERPGAILFGALSAERIEGVTVTPVECLSNCSRGCTIALRGAGRWTYVYGAFDAARDVPAIREGVAKYGATRDGLVPWRERPEHFRRNCIARIPPIAPAAPNLTET
ncbi:MAG: DUF1636 family protein [Roseicyclus sp.]